MVVHLCLTSSGSRDPTGSFWSSSSSSVLSWAEPSLGLLWPGLLWTVHSSLALAYSSPFKGVLPQLAFPQPQPSPTPVPTYRQRPGVSVCPPREWWDQVLPKKGVAAACSQKQTSVFRLYLGSTAGVSLVRGGHTCRALRATESGRQPLRGMVEGEGPLSLLSTPLSLRPLPLLPHIQPPPAAVLILSHSFWGSPFSFSLLPSLRASALPASVNLPPNGNNSNSDSVCIE